MIKVLIKNLQGAVTHSAILKTQPEVDQWLVDQKKVKAFGKNSRLVAENQLVNEGENADLATEMFIEQVSGQEVKFYRFLAEYTVEQVDAAAEVAAQKKLLERQQKRIFGLGLIDTIASINEGKALTPEQVDALMSNSLIASLSGHLAAGNIDTFINKLQASDVSAFFSGPEKAAVIAKCEAFLQTLGG